MGGCWSQTQAQGKSPALPCFPCPPPSFIRVGLRRRDGEEPSWAGSRVGASFSICNAPEDRPVHLHAHPPSPSHAHGETWALRCTRALRTSPFTCPMPACTQTRMQGVCLRTYIIRNRPAPADARTTGIPSIAPASQAAFPHPAPFASPRLAAPRRNEVFAMIAAAPIFTRCPDPSPDGSAGLRSPRCMPPTREQHGQRQ